MWYGWSCHRFFFFFLNAITTYVHRIHMSFCSKLSCIDSSSYCNDSNPCFSSNYSNCAPWSRNLLQWIKIIRRFREGIVVISFAPINLKLLWCCLSLCSWDPGKAKAAMPHGCEHHWRNFWYHAFIVYSQTAFIARLLIVVGHGTEKNVGVYFKSEGTTLSVLLIVVGHGTEKENVGVYI